MCKCTEQPDCCKCCIWVGELSPDEQRIMLIALEYEKVQRMTPEELEQRKEAYRRKYQ